MRDRRKWPCAAALLLALMLFAGCAPQSAPPLAVDPVEGAISRERQTADLYFANASLTGLVAEPRVINVPANADLETSVLLALIDGPRSAPGGALINPNTRVVDVTGAQDVLFITLSHEFLDWSFLPRGAGDPELQKRLAVYSVVTTMVEVSGYARVQLLVDADDSGTGQRISLADIGFEGGGVLEPIGRSGALVSSPAATAGSVLAAMSSQDLSGLYALLLMDGESFDEEAFAAAVSTGLPSIESYQVREVVAGADSDRAVVMIDYTYGIGSGSQGVREDIPLLMLRDQNGQWKLRFSSFWRIFMEE